MHRIKADEAYQIGERGHPVRAYLDIDEIIRAARQSGADAIYPGYGFLSENPDLARACAEAGITFIGPPADVLELAGNKVRALEAARAAGIPTLRSTPPSADLDELVAGAEEIGFPVFVKAVAGGGGRGMRRVDDPATLRESVSAAMREAEGAFGDPTVFIEQAVGRPRHIEVQILADTQGTTLHLFERDCSIQRRHQKVIEIAPGAAHLRRAAGRPVRRRGEVRRVDRLLLRRHGGVPGRDRGRAGRPARVHRDEPADPGRAHRHRGDHRRRPGPGPDADRRGGVAWPTSA